MLSKLELFTVGVKILRAFFRNRISGHKVPLIAYILVTNRCHLNCVYCYSNAYKAKNMDIPLGRLYDIIDQLNECGTVMISLTGGEACLREDIGDIIKYISQKGMLVELLTSGFNFEKNLEAIKGVDFLCISIDGGEEEHDRNRGKGSFKVAMKALELARKGGIHTRIHACFTRHNASSLHNLMEITKKFNVRANIAIPSIHTSDPSIAFDDETIREYYRQMKEYKRNGYLISNATSTLDFISNWPGKFGYVAETPDPNLPYLPCKRKDFCMYIDSGGYAYPCVDVWEKYKTSVYEKGVREAFNDFQKIPCTTCIGEAEFNLLFQASFTSILNAVIFGFWEKVKNGAV